MSRRYENSSSSSSLPSSNLTNLFAEDLHRSLTLDDTATVVGRWDPRKFKFKNNGSGRRLTRKELYDTIPKEEINAYRAKVKETEGFDVSDFPYASHYGSIYPFNIRTDKRLERLSGYARYALDFYNKDSDISYELAKVVRASWTIVAGCYFYITFVVKSSSSSASNSPHLLRTFQAKVFVEINGEVEVQFCRPEPPTPPAPVFVQKRDEARLSNEDSRTYETMLATSDLMMDEE